MTIALHELRRGRIPFIIWTAAVSFLLAVSVLVYPEMKGEMDELGDMFSSMGAFTSAFGMDKLNFGTLTGYYAIECGNVLGLGGAFFAAMPNASRVIEALPSITIRSASDAPLTVTLPPWMYRT